MATTPMDAQKLFSGTVAPEGADKLDEAKLTAWMEANVEGFKGPLRQGKFAGGQSNPTYRIDSRQLPGHIRQDFLSPNLMGFAPMKM